jgi:hypothetical protein
MNARNAYPFAFSMNGRKIRKLLNISSNIKIFGVLALGYSDENILNIPKGYEVPVFWNGFKNKPV